MSHIDCRALTLDASRLALVTRAARRHRPPLALLVTPEQRAGLDLVDGVYVDDVPVTMDAGAIPPPKPAPPAPEPEPRPLADLQRERADELQQAIRDHVDAQLPPPEREVLASIAAGLAERAAFGVPLTPTEQGVAVGLMGAREWTMRAVALGGEVAARCAVCTSAEELAAVTVDLASLGEPPRVTAGEIALALRGA